MVVVHRHLDSPFAAGEAFAAEGFPELFEAPVQIVAHHTHALPRPFGDLFCCKTLVVDKLNGPALSRLQRTQYLIDQDAHLRQRIPEWTFRQRKHCR